MDPVLRDALDSSAHIALHIIAHFTLSFSFQQALSYLRDWDREPVPKAN
jgi:hypothetical protein